MSGPDVLTAALWYAGRGWHVFPVRGKAPAIPKDTSWQDLSTTDPDAIAAWFAGTSGLGIGCDLAKSGLTVVDGDNLAEFDIPEDMLTGAWTYHGNRDRLSWMFTRNGHNVPQAGHPWGEVKSAGGYVVLPPSPHPSGVEYIWLDRPDDAPGHVPEALLPLIAPRRVHREPERPWTGQPATEADNRRAMALLSSQCDRVALCPEGGRNRALNAAALVVGHYVPHILARDVVEDALMEAARRCGLVKDDGERACQATVRSGMDAGMSQPQEFDYERTGDDAPDVPTVGTDHGTPDWPPPRPLRRGEAPIPLDALPEAVRRVVAEVSQQAQTPPEISLGAAMGALSAATRGVYDIHVHGGWNAGPSTLWTATLAESGERKDGAVNPVLRALQDAEHDLARRVGRDAFRARGVVARLLDQAKDYRKAGDWENAVECERQAEDQAPREPVRLILDDGTTEAIGVHMTGQRGATAIFTTEASAFRTIAGAYSDAGANTGLLNKAHDGTPYRDARIKRASIDLPRPALTWPPPSHRPWRADRARPAGAPRASDVGAAWAGPTRHRSDSRTVPGCRCSSTLPGGPPHEPAPTPAHPAPDQASRRSTTVPRLRPVALPDQVRGLQGPTHPVLHHLRTHRRRATAGRSMTDHEPGEQMALPVTNTTAAGSRWRRAVQVFLADKGIRTTYREHWSAGDDVQTVDLDPPLSIEAKAHRSLRLSDWMDQAVRQRRAPGSLPIVVAKRRGRPVGDAYAVVRLADLPRLLRPEGATTPEPPAPPDGICSPGP